MSIKIFYGDRIEALKDKLVGNLGELKDPFETREIVVPNGNLAKWLKIEIARAKGVTMGVEFPFLDRFLFGTMTSSIPGFAGKGVGLVDEDTLMLAIGRILAENTEEKAFAPFYAYCGIRHGDAPDVDADLAKVDIARKFWQLSDTFRNTIADARQTWTPGPGNCLRMIRVGSSFVSRTGKATGRRSARPITVRRRCRCRNGTQDSWTHRGPCSASCSPPTGCILRNATRLPPGRMRDPIRCVRFSTGSRTRLNLRGWRRDVGRGRSFCSECLPSRPCRRRSFISSRRRARKSRSIISRSARSFGMTSRRVGKDNGGAFARRRDGRRSPKRS